MREGAEHGDLFVARRPKILCEQRAALVVQILALRGHDPIGVGLALERGIDARDLQVRGRVPQRVRHVCRGVRRAEMNRQTGNASSLAIAAAMVSCPTPPLPITMMSPFPSAASSSTRVASRGNSGVEAGVGSVDGNGASGFSSARSAGRPTILKARKGTSTIGSARAALASPRGPPALAAPTRPQQRPPARSP